MSDFWMSEYNYDPVELVAALKLKRLRYICAKAINIEDGHEEEVYLRVPADSTVEYQFAPWHNENLRIANVHDVSRDEFLEAVAKPVFTEAVGGEF